MKDKIVAQVSIRLAEQDKRIAELTARNADLEATLAKRCEYHHLPLHNGWAHLVKSGVGGQRLEKVVRCRLSKEERELLVGGK